MVVSQKTACSICKNLVQTVFKDTWVVMNMNMHINTKASLFVSKSSTKFVVMILVFTEVYG
jgi:hypothetical protein